KHHVSMWIVANREYNEDPVFRSLVSPSQFAARRRTILVFTDRGPGKGVERLALGGGSNGGLYTVYRDPDVQTRELWGRAQWSLLRKVVDERKPDSIALDISHTHAFSDGLSAGEREELEEALGPWKTKIVRAEEVPLDYLAIRIPEMVAPYRDLMRIAHGLIARAFSNEVITPGKTTTADVEWWAGQRGTEPGLGEWVAAAARQRPRPGGVVRADRGRSAPRREARRDRRREGGRRDPARRPSSRGLWSRRPGPRDGYPARRLRPAGRGDRRTLRTAAGTRELQPASGSAPRTAPPGADRKPGP